MLPPFQYALRRTLPPWSLKWRLKTLESVIDSWRLDEIVLNIDAEEFNHAQLNTEWLNHYLPLLKEAKKSLEAKGVRVSFNPWGTVGQYDNGRDGHEVISDFQGIVDINGSAAQACSCMLSKSWRVHVSRLWESYAALRPYAIWLETDLRHFGHSPNVEFGCFCEEHLRRFSERAGLSRTVSREELRAALLQPGEPHPWRKLWLEMQGEETNDVVEMLTRTVHAVSPETRLGLMPSAPRAHTTEGRDWKGLRLALNENGTRPYLSRPHMGTYMEITPLNLYNTADCIILTRKLLPNSERELASLENFPYSRVTRSLTSTGAELLLAAVAGSDGVVMGLFDAFGNPMEAPKQVGAMLREMKPRLIAISQMRRSPGRDSGINVAFSPDYGKSCHIHEPTTLFQMVSDGVAATTLLGVLGVSWIYDDTAAITILTGQTARALPDALILKYLAKGLWLDAAAAVILQERGFGEDIGVARFSRPMEPSDLRNAAGEEFLPATTPPRYDSLFVPNFARKRSPITLLTPAEGAQMFSRAVDNDGRPLGCTGTLFRNRLGGRVFVHAFTYDPHAESTSFCTPLRLEALRQMLDFLDGGTGAIPLRLTGDGVCPYPLRRDLADGRTLVGFMNFSNDPWEEFTFQMPDADAFSTAETLEGAAWLPQPLHFAEGGRWTLRRTVRPKEAFFALLQRKDAALEAAHDIIQLEADTCFKDTAFPLALLTQEGAQPATPECRRHRHDFHELLILGKGHLRLLVGERRMEMDAGDVVLIPPGTVHALNGADGAVWSDVRFAPLALPFIREAAAAHPLFSNPLRPCHLDEIEFRHGLELLRQIDGALATRRPDGRLAALTAFAKLLKLMAPDDKDEQAPETQLLLRLGKAVAIIEGQYGRRLTGKELAASVNASVRSFQRLFMQAFGTSPMEYLLEVRLNHAEQLLVQGRLAIGEIAYCCGFAGASRFAGCFKRKFGLTPQEYRNHLKQLGFAR